MDGAGRTLNEQHDYVLHFPPGGLPTNDAFWSLTMLDSWRAMLDNSPKRCSVGDQSGLVPDADGAIDIYLQYAAPAYHESNWLPAPAGDFLLLLRAQSARRGRPEWRVPSAYPSCRCSDVERQERGQGRAPLGAGGEATRTPPAGAAATACARSSRKTRWLTFVVAVLAVSGRALMDTSTSRRVCTTPRWSER